MKPQGSFYDVFAEVEAPKGLADAIRARIALVSQKNARLKALFLGISSLVFGSLLVPALHYAGEEFYTSGFYDYFTLAFSGGGAAVAWREFAFSMLESLPSFALLLLGALALAFVWSLRKTIINAKIAFSFS